MSVVNPDTQRSIKIGSATYNRLVKEGRIKAKVSPKKASPKKTTKSVFYLVTIDDGNSGESIMELYTSQESALREARKKYKKLVKAAGYPGSIPAYELDNLSDEGYSNWYRVTAEILQVV